VNSKFWITFPFPCNQT